MLIASTVLGLFNGLVCLPVFLSMFGPPPEVCYYTLNYYKILLLYYNICLLQIIPLKYADRISTPSPEPIKKRVRYTSIRQSVPPPLSNRSHHQQNHHKNHHQKQGKKFTRRSLSTIAEESGSYHSTSLNNVETNKSQVSKTKIDMSMLII